MTSRAAVLEAAAQQLARVRLVVHDQHAQRRQVRRDGSARSGDGVGRAIGARAPPLPRRQAHAERRAPPFALALGRDAAAVQLDQVPHDRQAETEAAVRARRATRRPGGSARRRAAGTRGLMPWPGVRAPRSRSDPLRVEPDRRPARPAGVNLIALREQVPHDLLQPVGIAGHRVQRRARSASRCARPWPRAAGRTASSAASHHRGADRPAAAPAAACRSRCARRRADPR